MSNSSQNQKNNFNQMPQIFLDTVLHPVKSNHPLAKNGLLHAHMTGDFHELRDDKKGGKRRHAGVDFNYFGGQSGENMKNPTFYSPVAGKVINDPKRSTVHTISILDANGMIHKFLHAEKMFVKRGDVIEVGEPLGKMGDYNSKDDGKKFQHMHYEIRVRAANGAEGREINPIDYWRKHAPTLAQNLKPNLGETQQVSGFQAARAQSPLPSFPNVSSEPPLPIKAFNNKQDSVQNPIQNSEPQKDVQKDPQSKNVMRYNTLSPEEYRTELYNFIAAKEGKKASAYADAGSGIAIGVGFNLTKHSNGEINKVFREAGLPTLTERQKDLLNETRVKNGCSKQRIDEIAKELNLNLDSKSMEKLFHASSQEYEKRLDRLLKPHAIPESNERIALMSMTYQGRMSRSTAGNIKDALDDGNRPAVVKVIADLPPSMRNHPTHARGLINRANSEAEKFSMFEKTLDQTHPKTRKDIAKFGLENRAYLDQFERHTSFNKADESIFVKAVKNTLAYFASNKLAESNQNIKENIKENTKENTPKPKAQISKAPDQVERHASPNKSAESKQNIKENTKENTPKPKAHISKAPDQVERHASPNKTNNNNISNAGGLNSQKKEASLGRVGDGLKQGLDKEVENFKGIADKTVKKVGAFVDEGERFAKKGFKQGINTATELGRDVTKLAEKGVNKTEEIGQSASAVAIRAVKNGTAAATEVARDVKQGIGNAVDATVNFSGRVVHAIEKTRLENKLENSAENLKEKSSAHAKASNEHYINKEALDALNAANPQQTNNSRSR